MLEDSSAGDNMVNLVFSLSRDNDDLTMFALVGFKEQNDINRTKIHQLNMQKGECGGTIKK